MISVCLQGIMEPCWDQITVTHADICQQNVFVLHDMEFVRSYNPIFANWNCRESQFITHMPPVWQLDSAKMDRLTSGFSAVIMGLWSHLLFTWKLGRSSTHSPGKDTQGINVPWAPACGCLQCPGAASQQSCQAHLISWELATLAQPQGPQQPVLTKLWDHWH